MNKWENKARILYEDTKWEKSAIDAGRLIDNRLNFVAKGPYGQSSPSSVFDMHQYFAYFDYQVLVNRNIHHRIVQYIL